VGLKKDLESQFSVSVKGHYFRFNTGSGVFSQGRLDSGTRLLADNMTLPEGGSILDLGCGYGPLGIIAAKINPELEVLLTDNNPNALRLAKLNGQLNHVKNVELRLGSIYEPVESKKFNLIISNPPLSAGFSVVSGIIRMAPVHLKSDGALEVVVRKGFNIYKREFENAFGNVEVLARGSGYRVFHSILAKT
jgi:16S rRNA (guanine1207-N2)-methyltransferase